MNHDIQNSSFREAYLKVIRAQAHFRELIGLVRPSLTKDLYKIGWVNGRPLPSMIDLGVPLGNNDFVQRQLIYEPMTEIATNLALIVGDVVHNLRAALDYAATAVVRKSGHPTKFVTFPFHEQKNQLVPANSSGLMAIQLVLPDTDCSKFFQDQIKSYRDGNFHLWALTKLDKTDKHNMLVPTVAVTDVNIQEISGTPDNVQVGNGNFQFPADMAMALYSGPARENAEVLGNVDVTVKVSITQENLFDDAPLLETLEIMGKATLDALVRFDEFVKESS